MRDTSKWTLSLRGFLLQQIGSIISQLQSKDKEDCLALPLDNFLSTVSEVESLSVNVSWLKSHVIALKDLKKARPSVHTSFSSLCELRAKENSCINKTNEVDSTLQQAIHLARGISDMVPANLLLATHHKALLLDLEE
nr:hypothetical protein CFP56_37615 [Quercus suber]